MRRFWVEISATDHGHGGAGWELGTCLWSPAADRRGRDRYAIMREPQRDDVVYHLIDRDNERTLVGHSYISGSAQLHTVPPPQPGRWADFSAYLRIPLQRFTPCDPALSLREIEEAHSQEIRDDIVPVRPDHHPYVTYGEGIRIAQGAYLALLTNRMVEIFGSYTSALPYEGKTVNEPVDIREYQEGEQLRRERIFFCTTSKTA